MKTAEPTLHKPEFKNPPKLAVLFDMDGVLVDVSRSYRKAIQETVEFFSGEKVQAIEIQEIKEKGGYNNDWDLTYQLIKQKGKNVPKNNVIRKFQELYLGSEGMSGFIENEEWLISKEKLSSIHKKYQLGIITGRPREETTFTLKKFSAEKLFDVVVAMEDYPPEKAKPDPFPITLALKKMNAKEAIYVGDSIDDIKAAKRAGIRAIGCIPPKTPPDRLTKTLMESGAEKVLFDINEIFRLL